MEKATKAIEEVVKEETKELTSEEVMVQHEEATKPRPGMVYARLGRSYSNENYSSPQPQVVRGMAMSRHIVG
ncbi:hypothetical protein [Bacillus cereus group sp. TH152-1LC]|uniref:hypothetical protein n=1 Tax=Bacillus cereus group sp. TH152-1LC TaxID=3018060 RepID=UPI0022E2DD4C|nr:hypothetical protein [Bacillus cereus group sp. TH152-1LC]MDA1677026.1 hypothetical protein [Bacillus cereus group sp. TH152-1LC]